MSAESKREGVGVEEGRGEEQKGLKERRQDAKEKQSEKPTKGDRGDSL